MAALSFRVYGVPQGQGSKTAYVRGGRALLVEGRRPESQAAFKTWRESIHRAAQAELAKGATPFDGPLSVTAQFFFPRPKSVKADVVWKPTRPDTDKLARAVGDPLEQSGLIVSDARIACWHIEKQYAAEGCPPGVLIAISSLEAS
jgi:Holliday junction resolvase RusA-like endonuclease